MNPQLFSLSPAAFSLPHHIYFVINIPAYQRLRQQLSLTSNPPSSHSVGEFLLLNRGVALEQPHPHRRQHRQHTAEALRSLTLSLSLTHSLSHSLSLYSVNGAGQCRPAGSAEPSSTADSWRTRLDHYIMMLLPSLPGGHFSVHAHVCAALLLLSCLLQPSAVLAFNLDTGHVLKKSGEPGSLFGFSLALHRQLHPDHRMWVITPLLQPL